MIAHARHEIVLDLGRPYRLGGLRYLPRQDGGVNGRVSGYEVSFSDDGSHWKVAASGRFADDRTGKKVDRSPAARYVRRWRKPVADS